MGLAGAAVALTMAQSWGTGTARRSLRRGAWGTAAILLVVIPDRRLIVAAAYAPLMLFRSRFGRSLAGSSQHPTGATLVFRKGRVPWPVANQFLLVIGGVLWAGTAAAYAERGQAPSGWTTPEAAAQWGRSAVEVAVAMPLVFAGTRWAWALGVPLGITQAFFHEGQASGLWRIGGALATVAAGGAALTLGLTQHWGEVFPGWAVGLAGKPVPPGLAIGKTSPHPV